MKLIDILVQELPKRGGWPEGATDTIEMHMDGAIYFDGSCAPENFELPQCSDGWDCGMGMYSNEVTREQYEAALKQSVWDGTGVPPVGIECEVSVDGGRTWCSYKAINERNGVRLIEVGNFTEEFMVNNWAFRPIRTERDEAVHTIADLCRSAASNGHSADLIYNAIAEGKIPGIKLEKE